MKLIAAEQSVVETVTAPMGARWDADMSWAIARAARAYWTRIDGGPIQIIHIDCHQLTAIFVTNGTKVETTFGYHVWTLLWPFAALLREWKRQGLPLAVIAQRELRISRVLTSRPRPFHIWNEWRTEWHWNAETLELDERTTLKQL